MPEGMEIRPRRPHTPRPLAVALLSVLVALVLGVAAGPAGAAEPGVVLADSFSPHVGDLKALGTHWVRVFATWPDLEPTPGDYSANWIANYERLFNQLPAGTKVIVDVVDTPQWETGSSDEHTPPANPEDYAAFVGGLAQRFGPHVAAYELWNEEDSPSWWVGAPDPAAYAALLKASYPVIKAAEPNATVLVGGLTGNDYPFLEQLYQDGAKGYFDAVAVHTDTACNIASPYSFLRENDGHMIPDSFLAYREVHNVMLANGDDKPIWMTELSWRTTSAECEEGFWAGRKAQGVTEQQQATYLSPGLQLPRTGPVRPGGDLVPPAGPGRRRRRPAARQRLAQALVCRDAGLRPPRRSALRTLRVLLRTEHRRLQTRRSHHLLGHAADQRLRPRSPGRRAHHARDRRQADPQLHQPGVSPHARGGAALARRRARPTRAQRAHVHRRGQAAQHQPSQHRHLPPGAPQAPPQAPRLRLRPGAGLPAPSPGS